MKTKTKRAIDKALITSTHDKTVGVVLSVCAIAEAIEELAEAHREATKSNKAALAEFRRLFAGK